MSCVSPFQIFQWRNSDACASHISSFIIWLVSSFLASSVVIFRPHASCSGIVMFHCQPLRRKLSACFAVILSVVVNIPISADFKLPVWNQLECRVRRRYTQLFCKAYRSQLQPHWLQTFPQPRMSFHFTPTLLSTLSITDTCPPPSAHLSYMPTSVFWLLHCEGYFLFLFMSIYWSVFFISQH